MSEHANIMGFVSRKAAWHELGIIKGEWFSWEDALKDAKLNFSVLKSRLQDGMGRPVDAWGTFRWDNAYVQAFRELKAAAFKDASKPEMGYNIGWNADSFQAAKRPLAEKMVFLGAVGQGYQPIQHTEGFKLIDAMVGDTGGAHYETLGALGNGERVWGLINMGAKIGSFEVGSGGDRVDMYLLCITGHDGSVSFQVKMTYTRVVCQNTFNQALNEKASNVFKVRHTKNAQDRIAETRKMIDTMVAEKTQVAEQLNHLASRKVTKESVTAIMDRLFPITSEDGQSSTRRNNTLAAILERYEYADGNAFPDTRGSAWNLLNAVTEWTDHVAGTKETNAKDRANSAMFGTGDKRKSEALQVILEESSNMPSMGNYRQSYRVSDGAPNVADLGLV